MSNFRQFGVLFLTISLKKQYTQFNSAHNMNTTSEGAYIEFNCMELGGPSNKWLAFEMAKKLIYENSIIARGTLIFKY